MLDSGGVTFRSFEFRCKNTVNDSIE